MRSTAVESSRINNQNECKDVETAKLEPRQDV